MDFARNMFIILLTGIVTENFLLSKFLGICPFLGVSKKFNSALGMGIAVIAVMVFATMATYPIYYGVLVPLNMPYMQTVVFILVIALLVQIVEMALRRFVPPLYTALGVYLPLITTNCAVLGVTILNIDEGSTFFESVFYSFSAGVGFLLVMLIFSGVRGRIEHCNVPKAFRGTPITLIAASIVSLSFVGFGGIIDGIFGTV